MSQDATIDVADLRVGMFIHLDLGWLRHPFPLSSFRLGSEDQIAVIRGLGVRQVRWSPAQSDVQPLSVPTATPQTSTPAPDTQAQQIAEARRAALDAQRRALAQCEAHYEQAAKSGSELLGQALRNPASAGAAAQALSASLVQQIQSMGDLNLRLLTEAAGDRAGAHALNVTLLSLLLGSACGLGRDELLRLGEGALLHDVGKALVDARYRQRQEGFSAAEMAAYQDHVKQGAHLVSQMALEAVVQTLVLQHHEHADGSGFPAKLAGERQHPLARVLALANRFDGLCNPPLNGRSHTPHEALSLIFAQGRSRFDATLLNAFIRMMGVYPPGSAVQLTDERYALVMAVNPSRPLRPRVLVHDAKVPPHEALLLNLEEAPELAIRRSLRPADLPPAAQQYLRPRNRLAYFVQPAPTGAVH